MKTPFLGGETIAASPNLADNRLVNLYPEILDKKDGKQIGAFFRCPGLTVFQAMGLGPIRGVYPASNGTLYVVSGNTLYSVSATASQPRGTVDSKVTPVIMMDNGQQLLVVSDTGAWCLVFASGVFTQVLPGALSMVPAGATYQDGFALVSASGTNQFFQSNLNDFTTWQALNYSSADSSPYPIVGMYDLHREVWIFKQDVTEVWINGGLSPFAFQRLQGVQVPVGCCAKSSIARVGDNLLWLGGDLQGNAVLYMSDGYRAKRVSTHGYENLWKGYSTVSDAVSFTYQDRGHFFYVIAFPAGNATFCLDLSTMLWHERASFSQGVFNRHAANCGAYAYNRRLVGDWASGNLYSLDDGNYTDNGAVQKWLRSWRALPPGRPSYQPVRFNSLQIDAQTGIGIPPGLVPQMMLRWSDDGGNSWSNQMTADSNQTGQTASRVIFRRLGTTRLGQGLDRIFELSGTDPVPVVLMDADLQAEPA